MGCIGCGCAWAAACAGVSGLRRVRVSVSATLRFNELKWQLGHLPPSSLHERMSNMWVPPCSIIISIRAAQVLFAFTLWTTSRLDGQQTCLDLVYVHYLDSPAANASRASVGRVTGAAKKREAAEMRMGCQLVEFCWTYQAGKKVPWVDVVRASDILCLESLAPRYEGLSNAFTKYIVYSSMLRPSSF